MENKRLEGLVVISRNGYEVSILMLAPASFQRRVYDEFGENEKGKRFVKELIKQKKKSTK